MTTAPVGVWPEQNEDSVIEVFDEPNPTITTPVLSLGEFVREAWHVVEPSTQYVHNWHIDAIVEHLEAVTAGEITNLVINIPPRHMKSLLASVFWPCWSWTHDPAMRWLFASYNQSLSIRDSLKCRRLIQGAWYRERWGHVFRLTSDQYAKVRFENSRTGYRLASSVDGGNTGEGGDIVVADDPHNVKEGESDASRQAVLEWWDNVMTTRAGRGPLPRKVIVMQRVHERDLSGHVLEQGGYVHLRLPVEYEPKAIPMGNPLPDRLGDPDPRAELGELLWPERFGEQELAAMRAPLGSYGWAGQMQQAPSPAGGGILKRHWWRYWQRPGDNFGPVTVKMGDGETQDVEPVTLPFRLEFHAHSWDMAFKNLQQHDYVVGQHWAKAQGEVFLIDQVREHLDFTETVKAVNDFSDAHPNATAKWVEDKANGPAVISTLRQRVPGLIAVDPEGDKTARARAVAPYAESGNVFLPHPRISPWVNGFIEEAATFPAGAHDDQVDAFSQAVRKLLGPAGMSLGDTPYKRATIHA